MGLARAEEAAHPLGIEHLVGDGRDLHLTGMMEGVVRSPGLLTGRSVMRQEEPSLGGPLWPLEALRKILPFEAAATSDWLGCVGLGAARYPETPAFEFNRPALINHTLVLFSRPPAELVLVYEGVKRHVPPPAGSIMLVPAGSPGRVRWSGCYTLATRKPARITSLVEVDDTPGLLPRRVSS